MGVTTCGKLYSHFCAMRRCLRPKRIGLTNESAFYSEIGVQRSGELLVTENKVLVRAEGRDIKRGIYRDLPTIYKRSKFSHLKLNENALLLLFSFHEMVGSEAGIGIAPPPFFGLASSVAVADTERFAALIVINF